MKKFSIAVLLFLFNLYIVFCASVNVDELKILADTHFNMVNKSIENNTYFKFISSFDGGYKFAAKIAFEANVKELEKNYYDATSDFYNKVFMLFRSAEVTARNLIDSHFDLTFWTGTYKYLGSGNKYKGYMYYPESVDKDYEGFYRLRGTGITSMLKFWEEKFRAEIHFYENTNFVSSKRPDAFYYFSVDGQVGLYFKDFPWENEFFNLFVELYGGITFPVAKGIRAKAGLSFGVGNQFLDFFITGGLPKIDSAIDQLTFHHVFIASDFHFKLFVTDHIISFLTRPLYFNEKEYNENNVDFDINYRFNVAVADFPINGGFVVNFQYNLYDPDDSWHLYLNSFMDIVYSGVIWKISAHYDFSRIYFGNLYGNPDFYLSGLKIIVGASTSF
ncbi:MAG: hypothetical protein JXB50_15080 [Spirochaetes bacterium]|nr:hypothetical protein [Spirochaetota bacterium]